ncbi:outer membrane protein assembly factor BamB family protein [Peterkaempfera bronchialis]|uniref:Pyrrolo-quinoline quinone repeat domain-containing protein n=1 Tax=Peterkaempfera bronchialis TaxID=2126346 RepID=A0A345T264_9ACTN|nr:PQQ-binding-like beta-propeller repeat protein [Peterkaempfera bronchialis]AXI80069.1 hypothetical protein C7M71_024365 [Peterkaempfera bronchialis]
MAQEPSGSGGQQPSEYDYGQQWPPGQVPPAESGIPGGYEAYGSGQDAWGNQAQAQQQTYYGGYEQQQPSYGQDQYGQQQTGQQQYGQQSYDQQHYGQQQYGQDQYGQSYDTTGYGYADPYGGAAQGYQDYTAQQPYQDYQQPGAPTTPVDEAATQQWQAPDYGTPDRLAADGFPDPPSHPAPVPAATAPAAPTGDAPRRSLADRARSVLTGGSNGPDRRTLLIRTGIGSAALVVLISAGVYVAGGDGTGDTVAGDDSGASAGFSVDHTKTWAAQPAAAGADDSLLGSWLLAKAVVRGDGTGVHAYDLATGKQVWSLQPPKPGAVPCGMSHTVGGGGIGAVLYTPKAGGKNCTLLSAVDTATGAQQWTKTLSDAKGVYGAQVMVNDTRVVAVGDSKAVGYEAATGKQKWDNVGRGKFCTLSGTGSGNTVLLHSSCADTSPKEQVVALDAASGRLIWWRGLGTPKTVSVLSAEPAVVLTTAGSEADDRIHYWDEKGNSGADVPVTRPDGRLDVGRGSLDANPGVFFRGTTLTTALVPANGTTPANGSLTAVDLKTGRQLWKTTAQEKGKVQPVGIDGDALVVATEERTDQPAHLSRLTLADGRESAGGGFPKGTGSLLGAGRLLTADGLVVAVPTFTSTYGTSATAYQAAK